MIFLYFFPAIEAASVTPDMVVSHGLGDVARDCLDPRNWERRTARMNVAKEPSGNSGALLALLPCDDLTPVIGYYPAQQHWREIRGPAGPRWIGWTTDDPPRPETLRRTRVVPGYEVELPDGHVWTCPTIRRVGNRPGVPTHWGVGVDGQFSETVLDECVELWELSGEMLQASLGARDWTPAQCFAAAVRCLQLNYRVGAHEVTALRILTSDTFARVFKAAVDGDALQAYFDSPEGKAALAAAFQDEHDPAKKKTAEAPPHGMSSMPGPSAACPTTAPAGAN